VTTLYKKRSTYRFTQELEQSVIREAKKLGISKNAFVQMTLAKSLENDKPSPMSLAKEIEQKELSKTGTDRS
jgi:hypothetical protein